MDKLWLQHYQEGVPHEININEYTSIVELFEKSCQKFKDKIAYVNMDCEVSFAELDKRSLQFARVLSLARCRQRNLPVKYK